MELMKKLGRGVTLLASIALLAGAMTLSGCSVDTLSGANTPAYSTTDGSGSSTGGTSTGGGGTSSGGSHNDPPPGEGN